ncbi:MAG: SDR family NAD(P)-dependent oxidoreductase [Patescibacteria group bacterium]|jgi:short-subunit dehydrogenase|nr:SDR family NAD(P)-dependent oxidoreductase [Patescibacteria group bacterium]
MELKNKNVIVTGAGSGIGRELVLALLKKDAKVIAADLRRESLDILKKEVGENKNLITQSLDISDKAAVEKLAEERNEIDVLINNAGIIQPFKKVNDLEYVEIEKVMSVNFFGTLFMTKAFLPNLLKRPEAYIANVSSMGGFLPVPGQSIYGASKAAVKLFTEGLYAELLDTNVGVSVVFPGATATNITKNSEVQAPKVSDEQMKKFKALPADEAARLIIEGIENNKPQIFLGSDCKSMNVFYRLSPLRAIKLISNQMKSLLPK